MISSHFFSIHLSRSHSYSLQYTQEFCHILLCKSTFRVVIKMILILGALFCSFRRVSFPSISLPKSSIIFSPRCLSHRLLSLQNLSRTISHHRTHDSWVQYKMRSQQLFPNGMRRILNSRRGQQEQQSRDEGPVVASFLHALIFIDDLIDCVMFVRGELIQNAKKDVKNPILDVIWRWLMLQLIPFNSFLMAILIFSSLDQKI